MANRDTVRDNFNKVLDIIGLIISYNFDVKYLNFHKKKNEQEDPPISAKHILFQSETVLK